MFNEVQGEEVPAGVWYIVTGLIGRISVIGPATSSSTNQYASRSSESGGRLRFAPSRLTAWLASRRLVTPVTPVTPNFGLPLTQTLTFLS